MTLPSVSAHLTTFAVGYQSPMGRIADQAAPFVAVPRGTFDYLKEDLGLATLDMDTIVGDTGTPNEVDDQQAWIPGKVLNEALLRAVPNQKIAEFAGSAYDPQQGATRRCMNFMGRRREIRLATLIFSASSYAAGMYGAAGTKWDVAGAKPIDDILAARAKTFPRANRAVFGAQAWRAFRANTTIISAVNPTGQNQPTDDQIRSLLRGYGIAEVLVGDDVKNTAKKGQAVVLGDVWTDNVAVYYNSPEPNVDEPSFVVTFAVELAGRGVTIAVYTWEEPKIGTRGGIMVKVSRESVEKIVEQQAGYLITGVAT